MAAGGNSDIWTGMIGDKRVAIKVLRGFIGAHPGIKAKVRKVSRLIFITSPFQLGTLSENMERISYMVMSFAPECGSFLGIFI